jgi:antitoxin component YwqK of YwqJK toxin-antitoxin module
MANYVNNVLHGPLTRFWPDGKVMEAYHYKDGAPMEAPKRYDPKGKEVDSETSQASILNRLEAMVRGK